MLNKLKASELNIIELAEKIARTNKRNESLKYLYEYNNAKSEDKLLTQSYLQFTLTFKNVLNK